MLSATAVQHPGTIPPPTESHHQSTPPINTTNQLHQSAPTPQQLFVLPALERLLLDTNNFTSLTTNVM
jgi:hypothetical protein